MKVLRLALDVPLPRLFDYRSDAASQADIGKRVVVPFGARSLVGVIVDVGVDTDVPLERLRPAGRILDDMLPLTRDWLQLAQFAAQYYQRPLGEVIHTALPPRLRRPRSLQGPPEAYAISDAGRAALATLGTRARARRAILELLVDGPQSASVFPPSAPLRALIREGMVVPESSPDPVPTLVEDHPLTPDQVVAVAEITASLGRYQPFLLAGVTGSGKTEVYLRCVAQALARGGQALLLVPEINLTPQLQQAIAHRLPGVRMVTLTSALAANERAEAWLAAQSGAASIVLGTRLAVFAPLPRLALVVVDEEHDLSFKQQEGVRYSARDLAVYRARAAGVPAVLCSATPSLETWAHARAGRYQLLHLPQRARPGSRLPTVRVVDTRTDVPVEGLTSTLASAIDQCLARGEQSLIFLNRRGYAPVLACGACGWASGCTRCAAHLVLHTADRRLRCHHCGYETAIPRHCPTCGNVDLAPFGRGTQRLEQTLAARFPTARVVRIDSDSTRRKGQWERIRESIASGAADILVGTQILAKGHDFPGVTLVGVLNADAALVAADYRAPERLFAQLYQVAGRAGRAQAPGEVLVQTRFPEHPLYQALIRHEFASYAETLLAERRNAGFPPFVHEAVLRAESDDMRRSLGFLGEARAIAPEQRDGVALYDPVPMTLARLSGRERAQVLAQSSSRRALQSFLADWSHALYNLKASKVRWHLDVDPIEF